MNDRQRKLYERGQRVRLFMTAREADFPPGGKASTLGNSLEGMLADAAALDVARADSRRKRKQGTEARDAARTALRRMLKTTYDTAKPLELDHPEIKGVFKPPYRGTNDQEFIAAARSAVNASAQFAALFTESGLPPAFFAEMTAKADDIEISAATQTEAVGAGVDKTAALADLFRRMDDVVERLEPLVTNKYANDPAKLAAWESARRLERAPRRDDDEDEDDDATNNPTAPPPPTNT